MKQIQCSDWLLERARWAFLVIVTLRICACTAFVYGIHINLKSDMTLQRCWLIFIRACTILFMYS